MSRQHLRETETGRDSSREDLSHRRLLDGSFFSKQLGCITSKSTSCIILKSMLIYTCPKGQEKRKEVTIMETVSYTLERRDTKNFHGWVILECHDNWDDEIFSSTSLEEAKTFLNDLTA